MSGVSTSSVAAAPAWLRGFSEDGFALVPGAISEEAAALLVTRIEAALSEAADAARVRRRESVFAVRDLLDAVPAVRSLAGAPEIRALVEPVLGMDAAAVRGILFDKTPDANWKVSWHQDLSIAVRERAEAAGFGPWSEKAGVVHVQPPAAVLERMVTVRLNLDPCGPENGPVRVIPGSHRHGRLTTAQIERLRGEREAVATCLPAGGALLMRPLLLHASSPATQPAHRRVVHLEFAADPLPHGLAWHTRV